MNAYEQVHHLVCLFSSTYLDMPLFHIAEDVGYGLQSGA
jgi:hypothetical protein